MRTGKRLAFDVGQARVGIACSDPHGILASPLATVAREVVAEDTSRLFELVPDLADYLEIYVGLPINMKGESTSSTKDAVDFATELTRITDIPIRLIDERLTTSLANTQLRSLGKSQKDARSTIDQMAAVAILEYAFQIETNTGATPGVSLEDWRSENE